MPRILFVATLFSPLAARWISQLADTEWDVHVFGVDRSIHPLFRGANITMHTLAPMPDADGVTVMNEAKRWTPPRGRGKLSKILPANLVEFIYGEPIKTLENLIRKLKPDLIHSLKMQPEGYQVHAALNRLRPSERPPWIYSVWGNDIFLYRHLPEHLLRINAILPHVDYLMADNPRDIALAVDHGFRGEVLGVFPGGGGYPVADMQRYVSIPPSQRRIIAVKGYQLPGVGQAIRALEALRRCGPRFDGYRIVVHSAMGTHASRYLEDVQKKAAEVERECGVPVEFLPYSPVETIWELFSQSRIAIAISESDGTPNAMLEAMITGAFPIQSDTGGLEQWVTTGQNGALVRYDDEDHIKAAILTALADDRLVDRAGDHNRAISRERLDISTIQAQVRAIYARLVRVAETG